MHGDRGVVGDDVEHVPARVGDRRERFLDLDDFIAIERGAVEVRSIVVRVVALDPLVVVRLQCAQIDREFLFGHDSPRGRSREYSERSGCGQRRSG